MVRRSRLRKTGGVAKTGSLFHACGKEGGKPGPFLGRASDCLIVSLAWRRARTWRCRGHGHGNSRQKRRLRRTARLRMPISVPSAPSTAHRRHGGQYQQSKNQHTNAHFEPPRRVILPGRARFRTRRRSYWLRSVPTRNSILFRWSRGGIGTTDPESNPTYVDPPRETMDSGPIRTLQSIPRTACRNRRKSS